MAIDKAITDLPVAETVGNEDLFVMEQNNAAVSVTGETLKTFIGAGSGGGISNEAKQALLALLEKVAYTDDQGQTYFDALEAALYPPADLVSISAVFNQGSVTIYDTDTLDTLKQYLTVTALYSDSTTEVVTAYTLSGTLTAGTSTITVTYGGKTDTFSVTVTQDNRPWKTLNIENDFVAGGNEDTYIGNQGYYNTRTDRTSYPFFDIPISSDYKYTFEYDSTTYKLGVPYYSSGVETAVANHSSIAGYKTDPGWKSSGFELTPPSNSVCIRFTFNAGKTTLISAGVTELRIYRTAVS